MDLDLSQAEFANGIEKVARSFIETVEHLSEDDLLIPQTHGEWTGKDVIAHCTHWAEYCAEVFLRSIHQTFSVEDFEYDDEEAFDQAAVDNESATGYQTLLLRFRQATSEVADLTRALSADIWNTHRRYRLLIAGCILEEVPEHEYQLREVGAEEEESSG
jgi:hypothetical protein